MKRYFISILFLGCFLPLSFLQAEIRAINLQEFEKLRHLGVKVIDIRHQAQIDATGIIPGSYILNFYQADGKMNKHLWLKRFVTLVKDRYVKFVLISNEGKRAYFGANLLSENRGYTNPYYLEGGFQTWVNSGKKVIKK